MVMDDNISEIHYLMNTGKLKFNHHIYDDSDWWEGVGNHKGYYLLPVMNNSELTIVVLYNDGIIALINKHIFKYSEHGNTIELPRNIEHGEFFQLSTIQEVIEYKNLLLIYEIFDHIIEVIK